MYIGIDVGGTYTDAVLTDGRKIISKYKTPTKHEDIMTSMLDALDNVIQADYLTKVERVVI
ncbi:MAG TPA: hydantoinase/oxoprolinase N-terminal domain-containing protein, partial [Desulfobacteria bacterium]|nr:hydantoinase/oxoprolinase N-terminal domain-containing protein [Desulfobacteria bacterium]